MLKNKYKISYNQVFALNPNRCRNYFLIQAGEALCAKDTVVPEHQQKYFEITYVADGKGVSYINDIPVEIKKNDCFFSFPGETHKIISNEQEPLRFVFLAFYAKDRSQGKKLINYITQSCQEPDDRKYRIDSIYPLCANLLQELRSEDIYSERVIALLLEQILIECSRKISQKTNIPPQHIQTDSTVLTHDIITYIDQNIFSLKKIGDLENIFFYDIKCQGQLISRANQIMLLIQHLEIVISVDVVVEEAYHKLNRRRERAEHETIDFILGQSALDLSDVSLCKRAEFLDIKGDLGKIRLVLLCGVADKAHRISEVVHRHAGHNGVEVNDHERT